MSHITHIGSGNFSNIILVEEYKKGTKYAMKQYSIADVKRRRKTADLEMEEYVLNKLKDCKRVVRLYEVFSDSAN